MTVFKSSDRSKLKKNFERQIEASKQSKIWWTLDQAASNLLLDKIKTLFPRCIP